MCRAPRRLEKAAETGDFEALIAKVEDHLAKNPDDVEGWDVLAPAYKRDGRWDDAADAYAQDPAPVASHRRSLSDFGEMLVFAKQGLVTADARKAFTEALSLEPKLAQGPILLALALKQEGKAAEAKAALTACWPIRPPMPPGGHMAGTGTVGIGFAPTSARRSRQSAAASNDRRRPTGDDPLHGRWAGGQSLKPMAMTSTAGCA